MGDAGDGEDGGYEGGVGVRGVEGEGGVPEGAVVVSRCGGRTEVANLPKQNLTGVRVPISVFRVELDVVDGEATLVEGGTFVFVLMFVGAELAAPFSWKQR